MTEGWKQKRLKKYGHNLSPHVNINCADALDKFLRFALYGADEPSEEVYNTVKSFHRNLRRKIGFRKAKDEGLDHEAAQLASKVAGDTAGEV